MEKKDVSNGQSNGNINPEGLSRKESVLLYLHDFVVWLVAILLVFLLLFRVVVVSGGSMNDTLIHGDYLPIDLLWRSHA